MTFEERKGVSRGEESKSCLTGGSPDASLQAMIVSVLMNSLKGKKQGE